MKVGGLSKERRNCQAWAMTGKREEGRKKERTLGWRDARNSEGVERRRKKKKNVILMHEKVLVCVLWKRKKLPFAVHNIVPHFSYCFKTNYLFYLIIVDLKSTNQLWWRIVPQFPRKCRGFSFAILCQKKAKLLPNPLAGGGIRWLVGW